MTKRHMNGRLHGALYALTLAALLVIGPAAASGVASEPDNNWRLMVKSAACVQGPVVLLGEIADPVSGLDQRTWQTVAGIKLWKASDRQGRPVTVSRDRLKGILTHYLGDQVDNLILPTQLTVQTGGRVITGPELRRKVVAFLTPKARGMGDQVDFKELRLPMHYFFSNTYDKLSIEIEDLEPGRNQIRLKTVSSDGKVVSTKAGSVFINAWKAVPVAAQPMNRNERVTKEKVTFRRVNLAYRQDIWDGRGGPWRMARTLGRGQPFTWSHLDAVPLVEKGERVTLVYRGKRIQLSIKAESLGDAGLGQVVSVRNLQSKKTITATVVSDDTVVVR